jgi:hypothetical protein
VADWPGYVLSAALSVGLLILSASIVRADVGERIARRDLAAAAPSVYTSSNK